MENIVMNIRRIISFTAMIFVAITLCEIAVASPAEDSKPNIVIIFADDLGYGDVSCYGASKIKTPNIDRLAARGTRYTRAYCQGTYCGPSRASFMSGYYPHATGVLGYKSPRPQIGDRSTWSQHFKRNGYRAIGAGMRDMTHVFLGTVLHHVLIANRLIWRPATDHTADRHRL